MPAGVLAPIWNGGSFTGAPSSVNWYACGGEPVRNCPRQGHVRMRRMHCRVSGLPTFQASMGGDPDVNAYEIELARACLLLATCSLPGRWNVGETLQMHLQVLAGERQDSQLIPAATGRCHLCPAAAGGPHASSATRRPGVRGCCWAPASASPRPACISPILQRGRYPKIAGEQLIITNKEPFAPHMHRGFWVRDICSQAKKHRLT